MKKDIILAGIQGSGKGTQAQKLLEKYGKVFSYFETGNILRALMSNENSIGNYLRTTVNNGYLVKDEIIIGLFRVYLETLGDTAVLADGNLRRLGQTKGILDELSMKDRTPVVIKLEIPDDEVYHRLAHRKMCKKCGSIYSLVLDPSLENCRKCGGELYARSDDIDKEAIKNRLSDYYKETVPALEYVDSLGLLVKIDGTQSIDTIFKQIELLMNR